jgi:hypothetical protein
MKISIQTISYAYEAAMIFCIENKDEGDDSNPQPREAPRWAEAL